MVKIEKDNIKLYRQGDDVSHLIGSVVVYTDEIPGDSEDKIFNLCKLKLLDTQLTVLKGVGMDGRFMGSHSPSLWNCIFELNANNSAVSQTHQDNEKPIW